MMSKNVGKCHESHLQQTAEDTTEKERKDLDATKKQLLYRDKSKKDWRRINMITKGRHPGGLNELKIPDGLNT